MFNQVSAFLTQNNLLDSNQSGFRSGHSTETALLSVVEALRLARAEYKSSILILLDLSAAFDTVNHQILLSTLLAKGISGTALQWFESYLSDRSFKVSWRVEVSKSQHLTTGVTQGSVLGPLLFSIYMASLGSVIQKRLFISLLCWWHSTLPLIPSWWSDNSCSHLSLSNRHFLLDERPSPSTQPCQDRTACGSIKPVVSSQFHTIHLGTSTITPSKTARNLGVMIDNQLTFSDHIAKTAQSCRFALFNMPFLSEHASQLLVQALVLSRLDYCSALLEGLPASSIKPLQLIQNAAARFIFNEPKRMHVTPLFINLHWLPIAARIKFKALMFAYKSNHWLCTPLPKFIISDLCAL